MNSDTNSSFNLSCHPATDALEEALKLLDHTPDVGQKKRRRDTVNEEVAPEPDNVAIPLPFAGDFSMTKLSRAAEDLEPMRFPVIEWNFSEDGNPKLVGKEPKVASDLLSLTTFPRLQGRRLVRSPFLNDLAVVSK